MAASGKKTGSTKMKASAAARRASAAKKSSKTFDTPGVIGIF